MITTELRNLSPLATFSLAWIVGTAMAGRWLGFGPTYPRIGWLGIGCLILAVCLTLLSRSRFQQALILLFGVCFGLYWFGLAGRWAAPTDLSIFISQTVIASGELRGTPRQQIIGCDHVLVVDRVNPATQEFPVRARVQIRLPECTGSAGDQLQVQGKLVIPQNAKDSEFDYVRYLALQRIHYQMNGAKLIGSAAGKPSSLSNGLRQFNRQLENRINHLWPEPESSLLAGILLGARRGFDETMVLAMSRTGTTHIVAISGYNITLIIVLLSTGLGRIVARKPLFGWLSLGIVLFVFFVGASASVMRAGWMGWLYLLAKRLGRPAKVLALLLLAVWVMLVINPLQLWDLGFQLSVLATAGLILFYPPLHDFVVRRWGDYRECSGEALLVRVVFTLRLYLLETLLVTLAAQILVLPLIVITFGEFSLISPLANVAVLFAIPIAMATGFFTLVISLCLGPVGGLIGFPVWLVTEGLLWYKIQVIQGLSTLTLAAVSVSGFGQLAAWLSFGILGMMVCTQLFRRRLL